MLNATESCNNALALIFIQFCLYGLFVLSLNQIACDFVEGKLGKWIHGLQWLWAILCLVTVNVKVFVTYPVYLGVKHSGTDPDSLCGIYRGLFCKRARKLNETYSEKEKLHLTLCECILS